MKEIDASDILVYSCSGCSSAGAMTRWISDQLQKNNVAKSACLAGIGAGLADHIEKAKKAKHRIVMDGCADGCVKACLKAHKINDFMYYDFSAYGISNGHENFDQHKAQLLLGMVECDINIKFRLHDSSS